MGSIFRKLLNFIGITSNKLIPSQTDDLVEEDSNEIQNYEQGLYLQLGDMNAEVRLLQMSLRKKITHVLDEEDLDLCRSILSSNIKGINSQQYDYLISIMNPTKAVKIADDYRGLESYDQAVVKMIYYTDSKINKFENYFAPVFVSYVMQTAYPSWKFRSPKVYQWLSTHLPKGTYTRRIRSLDELKYEKVYIGGWSEASGDGHIFFIDPIKTAKGSFNKIHTIEGNTYLEGSSKKHSVERRIRKYGSGSKIKIFEVTV